MGKRQDKTQAGQGRDARLKQALKANLSRRKAAARAAQQTEPGEIEAGHTDPASPRTAP